MTEPTYLTAVRQSYDTVAAAYAETVRAPTELDPLSRAMLGLFAETVRDHGPGPVADLGCGPGLVTAYLARLGVPVFGLDLSPKMVELAARANPEVAFAVGSMTALPLRTGALGGILAYYSTHHTPPDRLPALYAELRRALAPGGLLMLAGHAGDGGAPLRPTRAYGGLPVSYETHLLPPARLAELLEEAGLVVTARLVQEPEGGGRRRIATLLAHKPRVTPS
ncbi:class I SAM-dependent methyltransferase [Streptomyces sp. NPDC101152]|uniref:class I SAM-dependent methyltransferase n=1 Tax=Streptomyces sp. NPDC101152 TaxID=3366116 RepID=UPI0038112CE5